jgi:hypothetical protein
MSALGKVNVLRTIPAAPLLLQRAHCACLRGAVIYGANDLNGAESIVTPDRQSLPTALNFDNFTAKTHQNVFLRRPIAEAPCAAYKRCKTCYVTTALTQRLTFLLRLRIQMLVRNKCRAPGAPAA